MNWNDIQYFIALVREQTLTATAEKLDVQHTTVARRIKKLEDVLNIQLFERIGKRYLLTEAGKNLYIQATEIENNVFYLQKMAINHNVLQGNVTISAPSVLANEILIPYLSTFQKQYPNISLSIQGESHKSNLFKNESDIALRVSRPTEDNLVIRQLDQIKYACYAERNYLKKIQSEKNTINFIEFNGHKGLLEWINSIKNKQNVLSVLNSNDFYMVKNSILQGNGIGILPDFLANKFDNLIAFNSKANNLKDLDLEKVYIFDLYLVIHSDLQQSAKIRAVIEWIYTIFNNRLDK